MLILPVSEEIKREIEKHFDKTVDVKNRIRVVSDLEKFVWKEDKSVWKQKRNQSAQQFSVYFDDEFVCGFDSETPKEAAMVLFWRGLKELYATDRIRLNKWKADELRKQQDEAFKKQIKEDPLDKLPEDTKEQKMAKDIVRRVNNAQKNKKPTIAD